MRALLLEHHGEPEAVLQLVDLPMPEPGPGEVRVRMRLSPVNPSDFNTIRGGYQRSLERVIWNHGATQLHFDPGRARALASLPVSPGADGMGVVEAAGSGWFARRLLGKRVIVMAAPSGNWREQVVLPAMQAMPVPSGVSDEQAAMFLVNPLTAWAMVNHVLRVPAGTWLLQSGGASQLARMVIRLGKRQGFRTINLVRRAEVAEELRALGADEVIDTGSEDLIARVASITANSGVRYALDCVGADTLALMLRCLAPGAHLVCYGSLGGDALNFPVRDLMSPAARIEGFLLPQWIAGQSLLGRLRATRRVGRLIADGILSSEVGQTYPLEQFREALAQSTRPGRGGKVLLAF
ncbi:MAG: zinc-dependent alcohol dehydrogenase family protein [Pseudomonadales bacterium]|jgi:NADPH:quinone reductase-like Zn-dependent oxidoreductase|nr:zinc-dependent alcohol dehydrogenase family protein [Gammaproteobacteria bacterium]MBP6052395.1 zinc-dependent alcohol dehydrogenase family protein [Pseudomonadales bacterium]MBK6583135.1 zinc-dependent alcohol dehydrogenase family protein [Gammaproteobacteria bacterium]MBK7170601.1 zinc-dependent alcohol dehydrogenase family protein [Gammaproteobacteria bacterium]MBK7519269.1 zinc-dependent alcohol dehydrogenase family protein [Gammaproteobacteria bacterium]